MIIKGDKFKSKTRNITYEVYAVQGVQNPNKPGREDVTIFLKQTNPSLWNLGTDLFITIPGANIDDYFTQIFN